MSLQPWSSGLSCPPLALPAGHPGDPSFPAGLEGSVSSQMDSPASPENGPVLAEIESMYAENQWP